jgi:hypothetical protein
VALTQAFALEIQGDFVGGLLITMPADNDKEDDGGVI